MSFSVDLVNLVLYCVQQLGVMLGVGAETIVLVVFFLATRDNRIEPKEEQVSRAVHRALRWGLMCIIASGLAITALHASRGQWDVVFAPAFLLKWLLVVLVGTLELVRYKRAFAHVMLEGLTGALWYALFVLHILAPVATWTDLLVLWAIWTAGFMACFAALVHAARVSKPLQVSFASAPQPAPLPKAPEPKKIATVQALRMPAPLAPKPPIHVPPPPAPAPAPVPRASVPAVAPSLLPLAPIKHAQQPVHTAPLVPHKPAMVIPPLPHKPHNKTLIPTKPGTRTAEHQGLPAIRVMPRTEEDMHKQNFAAALQSR